MRILVLLIAALLCTPAHAADTKAKAPEPVVIVPDGPDPYGLGPIIEVMRTPGVETSVVWQKCGFLNAYYVHSDRRVTLCTEIRTLKPGVIRYILAHELAHGVILQRDLAYVGSGEWAADELASLMLILIDHDGDVLDGSDFWIAKATPEDPTDDHLGDERRGWNMMCLVATANGLDLGGMCGIRFDHVLRTWAFLLGVEK